MAVPTITSISPSSVSPLAKHLLTVTGTNFNVFSIPVPGEDMSASIDGTSTTIKVASSTLAYVVAPAFDQAEPTTRTLRIDNLDSSGDPVTGEYATATLTYDNEAFISPDDKPHMLSVLEALITRLRTQFNIEVALSTDVDYTPDGYMVRLIAQPPCIVLSNFSLSKSVTSAANEVALYEGEQYRQPLYLAMRGAFILCCKSTEALMSYQAGLYMFQKRTPSFTVSGVKTLFSIDNAAEMGLNMGEGVKTMTLGFSLEPVVVECPEVVDIAFTALSVEKEFEAL